MLKRQPSFFELYDCAITHKNKRNLEIIAALEKLGGEAHYKEIARERGKAMRARGERVPKNLEPSTRNGLQRGCSLSPHYAGHSDFFRRCGNGMWRLVSIKEFGKRK